MLRKLYGSEENLILSMEIFPGITVKNCPKKFSFFLSYIRHNDVDGKINVEIMMTRRSLRSITTLHSSENVPSKNI